MSASIDQIADGVTTFLQANAGFATNDIQRVYQPLVEKPQLNADGVRIIVCPSGSDLSMLTRGMKLEEVTIDIGVFQLLPAGVDPTNPADTAQIDPLLQKARSIALLFGPGQLAGTSVQWKRTRMPLIYDPANLKNNRVFQSVIQVVYAQTA